MSAVTYFEQTGRQGAFADRVLVPLGRLRPLALHASTSSPPKRWRASAATARSRSSAGAPNRAPRSSDQPARLPARRHHRRRLRRLHRPVRDRSPRLGPSLLPPLQLGDERQLVPLVGARERQLARASTSPPGATSTTSSPRSAPPTPPGSGARTRTPKSGSRRPAEAALPRQRLRRLDLPRRLQLGPQRRSTRSPGAASTNSSRPPTKIVTKKVAPTKPLMLGEFATSPYGGHKAAWIRQMFEKLPRKYPRVRGFDLLQHGRSRHRLAAGDLSSGRQSIRAGDSQGHLRQQPIWGTRQPVRSRPCADLFRPALRMQGDRGAQRTGAEAGLKAS